MSLLILQCVVFLYLITLFVVEKLSDHQLCVASGNMVIIIIFEMLICSNSNSDYAVQVLWNLINIIDLRSTFYTNKNFNTIKINISKHLGANHIKKQHVRI